MATTTGESLPHRTHIIGQNPLLIRYTTRHAHLTSDRAQWHDPDYRTQDKALIQAWAASGAERVATWDYYFGAPYLYPRQFNQWIIESIRHVRRRH